MFPITFLSKLNPKVVVVGFSVGHWGDFQFHDIENSIMGVPASCSISFTDFRTVFVLISEASFLWWPKNNFQIVKH